MTSTTVQLWDFEWFRRTWRNRVDVPPPRERTTSVVLLGARLIGMWLVCWGALLALAARDGRLFEFLADWPMHFQMLLSVALLVLAEPYIGGYSASTVRWLREGELLRPEHRLELEEILRANWRRQDWVVVHLLLLALAIALSGGTALGLPELPWKEHEQWSHLGDIKTGAGQWLLWVSLPAYRFLCLRWLWRMASWAWVLYRVSRLPLRLTANHPDQTGGMGLLIRAQTSGWTLVLAVSVTLAVHLVSSRSDDASLSQLMMHCALPLGVLGVVSLVVLFAPLLALTPRLSTLKRNGLHFYADLGTRLGHEIESNGAMPTEETAKLFEGLSELFDATDRMRWLPISRTAVLSVAVAALAPLLPILASDHRVLDVVSVLSKIFF